MVWKFPLPLHERQSAPRTRVHYIQDRVCCRLPAYVRQTSIVSSRFSRYWDAHKGAQTNNVDLDFYTHAFVSLVLSRQNYSRNGNVRS